MHPVSEKRSDDVQRGLTAFRAQFSERQLTLLPETVRLLAHGEPVSIEALGEATGMSSAEIETELSQHLSIERDDDGRIVGWVLTLRRTPHRFSFNGRTVFGWCASDTLFFPVILGKSGVIESTDPVTKRTVRIEVNPREVLRVDPPEAVVTEVRPSERVEDIRTEICGLGLFVSSRSLAADWLAAHPEGEVKSVKDDFETHLHIIQELGWAAQ